jgi:Fur family ferric uptake transcriptional regulator
MTRQRQVILQELEKMKSHPTADEIYERVRKRLPRISLGTVYRNLETLSRSRHILKLELGGSQKQFDINAPNAHYHVRCTECGRLDDVAGEYLPDIENIFQDRSDYEITGHQLVLTGFCPRCKEAESQDAQGKEK